MQRLTKRSEYLKVARGARTPRRGFLLQSALRADARDGTAARPARFGFTVTKKTGNAVVRNRIRRRLKEAVRLAGAAAAAPGQDLVLIGRRPALDMPFADLLADVVGAVRAAARPQRARRSGESAAVRPEDGRAMSEEDSGP